MKLQLPVRPEWPQKQIPQGLVVQLAPEVTLFSEVCLPLPFDLQRWGDQVVMFNVPPGQLLVHAVSDVVTRAGWPVTLVKSDVLDRPGGQSQLRRIHALYRFTQYGAVAVIVGPPARMDALEGDLLNFLAEGQPDFASDEIIALSELFDGIADVVVTPSAPQPAAT
jgi:hypothetical protein